MGIAARQRRFVVRVFLLLDELPFKDDKPHLPEASGFEAPEYRLSPLVLSVKIAVSPDLQTNHSRRPGAGLGCQRLLEAHATWVFYSK